MGLDAVVRSAVATAKSVTSDLQDTVTLRQWTGQNDEGGPTYSNTTYSALVEHEQRKVTAFDGEEIVTDTTVTILQPVTANGDADRVREPVEARDVLVLPDGTTGAIQAERGLVDPSTSKPYMHELFLQGGA